MKASWYLTSLVVYITYFFAYGEAKIGTLSEPEIYSWKISWELAIYASIPAFLGYMVGKDKE